MQSHHLAAVLATDEQETLRLESRRIFGELIQPEQLIGDVYSLNYESAFVQIHDNFRRRAGGVPSMCLLLATRVDAEQGADFEQEDANLILLRVLDSAPLPNSMEAERIRVEVGQRVSGEALVHWDDTEAMDAVTANLLSYAGIKYAGSLGGVDTLVVHPAGMWSHELNEEQRTATGVSESLVRISVGLEGEQDLIADFAQALETLTG